MSTLKWIALTTAGIYLASIVALYFLQRQLLYFPRSANKYEVEHNFEFKRDDITLRGWVVNQGRPTALIYYGGNAERIDYYIKDFKLLFSGHTIYFVNYRSYGESEGAASEENLFGDALAIYDSVKHKHTNIDLLGKSLGSGIAVYVAAHRSVHKVALVTPYDSIANVAKSHYPIFPVSLILQDKYESWKYSDKITAPTLSVAAAHDQIIPAESTDNLATHINPALLRVKQIKDVDHNSISAEEGYYETLIDFFGQP